MCTRVSGGCLKAVRKVIPSRAQWVRVCTQVVCAGVSGEFL